MKFGHVGLVVTILAATAACKKSEAPPSEPRVDPVTQSGSAGSAGSAANDPWTSTAPGKDPLKRPLLWSVEKNGTTSYVFGTMHMGVDPHTRLPDVVWEKLDASKTFAMETDLSKVRPDALQADGKTLREELGDDYWKKLEDALGIDVASRLIGLKPMVAVSQLSMRGLPETAAMDGVLYGRALNNGKQIVFLESSDHQMSLLIKWMDARALKDMLDDVAGIEQRSKEMLEAYLAGDETKMLALADSERERWIARGRSAAEYDEQWEDLLYRRNASWIAPIEKLHASGGGFIAVGALHAIGPRSVLELLEKQGYAVTRLSP